MNSKPFIDEIYEEVLPNALMIGVEHDLFWTLNPKSLKPFVKAFQLRTEYDDRMAWNQGLYTRLAIASILDKDFHYPKKPISENEIIEKTPEEIQEDIKQKMLAKMQQINSQF